MNWHIASKCRFTHMNSLISRRDGGLPDKAKRFLTSTPHGCKMLFGENRSKCGVNAFSFDDSDRNPSKRIGVPCHFYSSSAAIHSDTRTTNAPTRNNSKLRKTREVKIWTRKEDRSGPSNDSITNLKKKIKQLLTEDISGKTETTRNEFHNAIVSLKHVDQVWAVDESIKLLEKMWEWNKAGKKHLKPVRVTYDESIAVFAKSKDPTVRKKAVIYLEKKTELLLNVDIWGRSGTTSNEFHGKSETTRNDFHDVIHSLKDIDQGWAVDASTKLLNKMWMLNKAGKTDVKPTKFTYNEIIAVYAKSSDSTVREKAVIYLEKLECYYKKTEDPQMMPNTHSYNLCLNSFAKASTREEAMEAEKILKRMQIISDGGILDVRPDTWSMNGVISAWSNCATKDGIERAVNMLERMISLYAAGRSHLKPNFISFRSILDASARIGDANRMEAIIGRMEELSRSDEHECLRPDTVLYNRLLKAYANNLDKESAEKAEELLVKMEKMHGVKPNHLNHKLVMICYANLGDIAKVERGFETLDALSRETGYRGLHPDAFTYNILIKAHSNSIRIDAAEKAEMVIERMQKFSNNGMGGIEPNLATYNGLMQCYARRGNAAKVESIISELKKRSYEENNERLHPDKLSYDTLLGAYSHSDADGAAEKAEATIDLMEKRHQKPNMYSFNLMMKANARSGNAAKVKSIISKLKKRSSEERIDHLRPNLFSYNTLLNAYANSDADDALKDAGATLELMYKLYEFGYTDFKPNIISYNRMMMAHANRGDAAKVESIIEKLKNKSSEEGNEYLRPDEYSYTTLINAHANSLDTDARKKAEMVLKGMKDLYESGDTYVEPNIFTYNALMLSYANCGDAAKVESMISALEDNSFEGGNENLIPNTASYNKLIEALAKSDEKDAPEKAEATLRKMQSLRERGDVDVEPNILSFNLVLACHARDGNTHHAEAIVNHIEKLHVHTGFEHIRPNKETYNVLIDAWVKSGDASGADNAQSILVKMKELRNQGYNSAAPDLETYSSIVNAYKNSKKDLPSYLTNEFEMLKNGE